LPLEAARQRLEAGRWATRLVAYDEAIAHLERGLALLERLAPTTERLRLESALCLALVNPTLLRQGWRAPAYRRALERLSELAQHPALKDDPHRLAALTVLAVLTNWSADPERARQLGEQLLNLHRASGQAHEGDRQSLMLAHWVLGQSHWLQGQLVAALEHLEQALALHDPDAGHPLNPVLGADPRVMGSSVRGYVLWMLGYPDQGRACLREALVRAEAIEQPSSAAFAHLLAGGACLVLGRDGTAAVSHAQALPRLGGAGLEYGPWAQLLGGLGQSEAVCGQTQTAPEQAANPETKATLERGLAQAAEAGSALQALGSGVGQASRLLIQAQMCALAGQSEKGLEAMDQAQAWIECTGVRNLQAEVWRMRGELLLQKAGGKGQEAGGREQEARSLMQEGVAANAASGLASGSAEAEGYFRRALGIAQEQQARWLEVRAAVSLARLWQAQGRRHEARDLVACIYGWFTEGFDTVDLVEAKALLDTLE
jgi:adenylate cyclase